jgi:hypothetical protein
LGKNIAFKRPVLLPSVKVLSGCEYPTELVRARRGCAVAYTASGPVRRERKQELDIPLEGQARSYLLERKAAKNGSSFVEWRRNWVV